MTSILVYRDTLFTPSETFIPRMYAGFERLGVAFLGTRFAAPVPAEHIARRVGDDSPAPRLARLLFRELGTVPRALQRWARAHEIGLVHAQFGTGGALALPLARALGVPLVVTFHGGDAFKRTHYRRRPVVPTVYQRRRAELAGSAALITCVSGAVREALVAHGFEPARLVVHYLGTPSAPPVAVPPGTAAPRLLFVGRLVAKKGLSVLLEALERLGERGRAVGLDVLGDGPELDAARRRALQAGLDARFHGWVEPAEVAAAMTHAPVVVVPSRTPPSGDREGLPTVILEAMARGLTIVATRHSGIPEAIDDGVTGLLVPEDDIDALAGAIDRLCGDPALRRQLGAQARARWAERFDAERQSRRLEALLERVVAERRPVMT